MEIRFTTCLPREEASIPVVRHLARAALERLGVAADSVADIALALTEACTNVLRHSRREDEYEVTLRITDGKCDIEVLDQGEPFDHAGILERPVPTAEAESGRGVYLMRALVDRLDFVARPNDGMAVHLSKDFDLSEASLLRRLAD